MAKIILLARYSPRPLPPEPTPDASTEARQEYEETKKRADEDARKNSCDRQIEEIAAWAVEKGHDVVAVYREDALSGDTAEERPTLTEALAACRRGMWLVVRDFQRLSRNGQFLMYTAADLSARGVKLYSLTEGHYEHDDDEAWLSFGVRALFGEYFRRKVKKRTKKRMLEHQANGRRMSKEPPYGKQADPENPKRWIDCDEEQATIARMIELRAAGLPLRKVGEALAAEGRLCRGRPWGHKTIGRILKRAEDANAA